MKVREVMSTAVITTQPTPAFAAVSSTDTVLTAAELRLAHEIRHLPVTGETRRFLVGPRGCEITGMTLTQRRGIGTALFSCLVIAARCRSINQHMGLVIPDNTAMLRFAVHVGALRGHDPRYGPVVVASTGRRWATVGRGRNRARSPGRSCPPGV